MTKEDQLKILQEQYLKWQMEKENIQKLKRTMKYQPIDLSIISEESVLSNPTSKFTGFGNNLNLKK